MGAMKGLAREWQDFLNTVLYERGVDRPSDIDGILYVAMADNWELDVAREIRATGISIDLNEL
jgi:predicted nucleotide-binding protein